MIFRTYRTTRKYKMHMPSLLLLAGCLAAVGCSTPAPPTATEETTTTSYTQGPVAATLTVVRKGEHVGDEIVMTLQADAPAGVSLHWPDAISLPEAFAQLDYQTLNDMPTAGGTRRWTLELTCEPIEAGDHTLPAIHVNTTDTRTKPPVAETLSTAPVKVTVASLLDANADPMKFCDIKGQVDIPLVEEHPILIWVIGAGVVLVAAGLGAGYVKFRRWQATRPESRALQAIDQLAAEDLISAHALDAFYTRLTSILRRYIEERFALSAPKQTTREFLESAQEASQLTPAHRAMLGEFLSAADLVKFARQQPSPTEANRVLATGRAFVEMARHDARTQQKKSAVAS